MTELMQKLDLRELRLLTLGVGAVLIAALVASLLMPKIKELRSVNRSVVELERSLPDSDELEQAMVVEDAAIQAFKQKLHGDMANLPVKQVEAYIIGRLQAVSWGNNVELVGVQPSSGDQVQNFQEILFRVRLIGQYGDLYRWLWDVRNELGFVVIKDYRLARHNDDDAEPLLSADLNLASYRSTQ